MKTGKLKYPCRVGDTLHPAGTEVAVLESAAEYKELGGALDPLDNPLSGQVAIVLPDCNKPIIHDASHVILLGERGPGSAN